MILQELTLPNVQRVLDDLYRIVRPLETGNIDLNGRRIINAGEAIGAFDYVRKFEMNRLSTGTAAAASDVGGALQQVHTIRVGLFATRGAPQGNNANTLFMASDRNHVGWISNGTIWRYAFGAEWKTQAGIAALTALLGTDDAGYLIHVSDYKHTLQWDGAALNFIEGDSSGYVAEGKPTGGQPNGGYWGLCDGSAYLVLNGDGTTTSITTVNRTDDSFVIGTAAADVGARVATAPKWITGAKTEPEETGLTIDDHDIDTLALLAVGTDPIVTSNTHGVNETPHFHTLTDGNAGMNPPDEVEGGLPARVGVTFWIRR